jgi:uncharacterized ferritin-like protein (DUF455 family)
MTPPFQSARDLRQMALNALCEQDSDKKVAQVPVLYDNFATFIIANLCVSHTPLSLPGRPEKPLLVHPAKVPKRSPLTLEGRAAMVHAIAHIEFNAINLALDALWRFDAMPEQFYQDWALVAKEEAYHFSLLRTHLRGMDTTPDGSARWDYGDFEAHDNLWAVCEQTAGDVVARMALVPRMLEARGLDATPQIQAKLRQIGTPDALAAVSILEIILRDEVGHVAIGNHWYHWLCQREGLDPGLHDTELAERYKAPRPKAPFNKAARLRAGFSESEMLQLERTAQTPLLNRPHSSSPSPKIDAT